MITRNHFIKYRIFKKEPVVVFNNIFTEACAGLVFRRTAAFKAVDYVTVCTTRKIKKQNFFNFGFLCSESREFGTVCKYGILAISKRS